MKLPGDACKVPQKHSCTVFFGGTGGECQFWSQIQNQPQCWLLSVFCKRIGGCPKKVISVAVWIYPGPGDGPPLFASVTLLVQLQLKVSSKQCCKRKCILWLHFCPKLLLYSYIIGWSLKTIHAQLTNLWVMCFCANVQERWSSLIETWWTYTHRNFEVKHELSLLAPVSKNIASFLGTRLQWTENQ